MLQETVVSQQSIDRKTSKITVDISMSPNPQPTVIDQTRENK
jgi:hypothetical protein